MSAEENKAVSRRADEELFDRGNLEVADELSAPNFVYHDPLSGEDWRSPQSVKQYAAMMRRLSRPVLHRKRSSSRRGQGSHPLCGWRYPSGGADGHSSYRRTS